jgi:hypothetical protein
MTIPSFCFFFFVFVFSKKKYLSLQVNLALISFKRGIMNQILNYYFVDTMTIHTHPSILSLFGVSEAHNRIHTWRLFRIALKSLKSVFSI